MSDPQADPGQTSVLEVEAELDVAVELELDDVLAGAVELARAAATEVGGDQVGEHIAAIAEGERVVTHTFAAVVAGYQGWHWAVTLARTPDSDPITVSEVVLLPGVTALLAPAWVPWSERIRPGDLGAGDLLPAAPDDPRLVPGYLADDDVTDGVDDELSDVACQLGFGRERVLSFEGRSDAAERWQDGANGPESSMAKHAPAHCGTCGFLILVAGSLRAAFGVCANEYSAADGQVVSVEYGCGAHSEAPLVIPALSEAAALAYDDNEIVSV